MAEAKRLRDDEQLAARVRELVAGAWNSAEDDRNAKAILDAVELRLSELAPVPATVYVVGNGTYLHDELHGIFAKEEDAQATAQQMGGMWEISAWDVEPGRRPPEAEEEDDEG